MFHYLIHYVLVKQLDNATCNRHLVTNKLLFFYHVGFATGTSAVQDFVL